MTTDDGTQGDDYFIYDGEGRGEIPRDVTHVDNHPSIKMIKDEAFSWCWELAILNLSERLEEIGVKAFRESRSLHEILIPPPTR